MSRHRKLYCSDCLYNWCRARLQCSTDICWQFWRIWDASGTSSHGTFQRHFVSQKTSTRLDVHWFFVRLHFFQAPIRSTSGFSLHLLFGIHVLSLSTLSPPSCTCIVRFQSMWHCSPKSKIPGFFVTFFYLSCDISAYIVSTWKSTCRGSCWSTETSMVRGHAPSATTDWFSAESLRQEGVVYGGCCVCLSLDSTFSPCVCLQAGPNRLQSHRLTFPRAKNQSCCVGIA
jgi:hypothetical protein